MLIFCYSLLLTCSFFHNLPVTQMVNIAVKGVMKVVMKWARKGKFIAF